MAVPSRVRSVGPREKAISVGVLLLLAGVLGGVLWQQSHFSPAVMVAATAAREAGQSAGASTAAKDLLAAWPDGLRAMSATEAFKPETLSDKIDGKAELYLAAGFVGMNCQRVALPGPGGAWLEVFIYDMGKPANAFAVYSQQKRPGSTEIDLGDYGYIAGNQLCLVHGKYYIEIVGADDQSASVQAARVLAPAFVAGLAVDEHANVAQDQALFPKEGLIAGSVSLVATDVFGFDRLQNVFIGRYREGGDEMALFIANRQRPAAAVQMAEAFRGFLVNDCGGKIVASPADAAGATIVDLGGTFDGFAVVGQYLAGVHQAPSREVAERMINRLLPGLRPAKP